MTLQPNENVGPYVLIRQLGRGAFGEVWLARHHHLDEERALKVPTDPAYVRQLRNEAQIQFRLNHPNIVRTLDLMPDNDPPFYVMEYVSGVNLRQKLLGSGKLPLAESRTILRQILLALEHAHAAGICHRDLKPENILCGADGMVKVTDFGFGKVQAALAQSMIFSGSVATATGNVTGTVQYMSPQQQVGEEADPRDDLYAVGVIACEMLTGLRPQTMGVTKMLQRAGAGATFGAILEKATEHDRKDRFASATRMRETLEKFGAATTVSTQQMRVPVLKSGNDERAELATVVAHQSSRGNQPYAKSRPPPYRKAWGSAGIAAGAVGAILLIGFLMTRLGCASEKAVLLLIDATADALPTPIGDSFRKKVEPLMMKRKFEEFHKMLIGRIRGQLPRELDDLLDVQLNGIFDIIRNQRNAAGHPSGADITQSDAHANLYVFPTFLQKVYAIIGWLKSNKLT